MWPIDFLCLAFCLSYAILLQAGLLKVLVTYQGSLGYFSTWGPMFSDGHP
jgi:hypothetical protein